MARRRSYPSYFSTYFEPSGPRAVEGGIKAKQLGKSWWAKRWLSALEQFSDRGRLTRGRSYARSGQVTTIDVQRGECKAKVQGSRPWPYEVSIRVAALDPEAWKRVSKVVASEARHLAQLLAGEVPQDIEDLFAKAGTPLFPEQRRDLVYSCTCPDWGDPCKHAAAVAYVLGEAFDADPFLMFRMRGMDRDELLAGLGPAPAKPAAAVLPEKGEPLSVDLAAFWGREGEVEAAPRIAASEGDPVHKLGAMPFWRAAEALEVVVARAQKRASKRALELLGGGGAAEAEVVVPVRKGRKKGSRHPAQ